MIPKMPKDYIHEGDTVCVSHSRYLHHVNVEFWTLASWRLSPSSMEEITLDTPFRVMHVEQTGASTYLHVCPLNTGWQDPREWRCEFFWFRFKPAPIVSISRRLTVRPGYE